MGALRSIVRTVDERAGMIALRRPSTLVLVLFATVCLILASASATWSAFSGSTSNQSNVLTAGTVSLSDNDGGASMFSVAGMQPEKNYTQCLEVTYTGSLPAEVRLHSTTTGTGLRPYLTVTVTRGSIASPSFPSCTGFTPDTGGGVMYSDTPDATTDWDTGVPDPQPAWATGEKHAYRIQITLADDYAAQGLTAVTTINWEARST